MKDTQGFQVAIEMLRASQEKGRNVAEYVQYDTIQRLQSSYGTVFDTSPDTVLDPIIFKNERGRPFQCSWSPLDSLPFQNFTVGLLCRVVKVVYHDVDIALDVLKAILEKYEAELLDSTVTWGRK